MAQPQDAEGISRCERGQVYDEFMTIAERLSRGNQPENSVNQDENLVGVGLA